MNLSTLRLGVAAPALAFALSAASAMAQTASGGTAGGVSGPGVSASTYGSGTLINTPDKTALGVEGGGAATAIDGTATIQSDAKLNERRAMQRSKATASDDDERARSRTHTHVTPGGIRSRTMSMYKQDGEKPVRETVVTRVAPDGTTTTQTK